MPIKVRDWPSETEEQREARLQRMRINHDERIRPKNGERPGCRGHVPIEVRDWLPRLKNRERPGCSMIERDIGNNLSLIHI